MLQLRPPSIDHGIVSFVWALVLGVLLWAFMIAVGVSKPTAFIIAAAAVLKLPDLLGHNGDGVRGQALAGALCAAAGAWVSVRFLMRYFETNRLTPFAFYCLLAGIACVIYFAI